MPVAPQEKPPHLDAGRHGEGPLALQLEPALEMLPEWEDRLRLRRVIFEEGYTFFSVARGSPEFVEATIALGKSGGKAPAGDAGYFVVCAKDRAGRMAGAMDGHMLEGGSMALHRSLVMCEKKREMHILLYAAALCGHQPPYVLFSFTPGRLTVESAALFILFGRGFGFSAIPPLPSGKLILMRRIGKELDPLARGNEIAAALESAKKVLGIDPSVVSSTAAKGAFGLVPLPFSPDSREHLHELRDMVAALKIPAEGMVQVLEKLRSDYVLARLDLTPPAFH